MQDGYTLPQQSDGVPVHVVSQQSSSSHSPVYNPAPTATPHVIALSSPLHSPSDLDLGDHSPPSSGSAPMNFVPPIDGLSFYRHVPQHSDPFSSQNPTQMNYFFHEPVQSPASYYPQFPSGPLRDSDSTPPRRPQRSFNVPNSSLSPGDIPSPPPLPPKYFHYSETLTIDDLTRTPPSRPAPLPPLPPKHLFPLSPQTPPPVPSRDIMMPLPSDVKSASRHPWSSPSDDPSPPTNVSLNKDAEGTPKDDDDLERALMLSRAHYDETAKKNSQLLEEHLSPLSSGTTYDEPLIVREENESESSPVDDGDDEFNRAIRESLRIAELGSSQATGSLSQSVAHSTADLSELTDDDGWEPYDPSAFEDPPLSSMQPSPEPLSPLTAPTTLPDVQSPLPSPFMKTTANTRASQIAPQLRTSASFNDVAILSQPTTPLRSLSTFPVLEGPRRPRSGSYNVSSLELRDGGKDTAREADPGTSIPKGSGELQRAKSVGNLPTRDTRPPPPLPSISFVGDLMTGVSYGYGRAVVLPKTAVPDPRRPFPNVISLGRGEVYFIATPTFRQVLRLLASLGHASITPKVQAYATIDANEIALRPTLQEFVTILWLEIGVPQSRSDMTANQRTHGDTARRGWRTALPESVQHRPGLGSHMYTCQDPLPILPLILPDLASYLQTLLWESRRASDSSGLRRLSKIVDSIYKKDDGDVEIGGRASVISVVPGSSRKLSGMLSRVIPRQKKKTAGTGANEETYDLVTPLRLD
ncbi:hypothetical protein BS47DRAFT_1341477 [Hydnum rufescens UP504]|uniref:Uncharacterized protein n=1 Tax=Hydnum rufescens UP504 TaxID=1448309 RepID=A0A9P6DYE3_9AGAM|nr:hypothetical protein BS47DRAFT_1341477 [Hydnum rufescens UP504]